MDIHSCPLIPIDINKQVARMPRLIQQDFSEERRGGERRGVGGRGVWWGDCGEEEGEGGVGRGSGRGFTICSHKISLSLFLSLFLCRYIIHPNSGYMYILYTRNRVLHMYVYYICIMSILYVYIYIYYVWEGRWQTLRVYAYIYIYITLTGSSEEVGPWGV